METAPKSESQRGSAGGHSQDSTDNTPSAGDKTEGAAPSKPGRKRTPKKTFFPWPKERKRKGRGTDEGVGPPQIKKASAGPGRSTPAEPCTHSSEFSGTAFRVYLEIILFLLGRGPGGHARVEASGPGPPRGSGPALSRHLLTSSRPVAKTAGHDHSGSPRLSSPPPTLLLEGAEVTSSLGANLMLPPTRRSRDAGVPGFSGLSSVGVSARRQTSGLVHGQGQGLAGDFAVCSRGGSGC